MICSEGEFDFERQTEGLNYKIEFTRLFYKVKRATYSLLFPRHLFYFVRYVRR